MLKRLTTIIVVTMLIGLLLSGCAKIQNLIVKQDSSNVANEKVKRETFLKVYTELEKEMKKKASDALFTGAIMMKTATEPWDGKSSVWNAGFYSQKNNKAYIIVWDKGTIKITKETVPDKGIKDRVITGTVAVDSSDALDIARATMITQVDSSKADKFKSVLLAYSNSLKKHVWAVSFEGNHRILIDAITGEVLEAK
jgi:hypothetical protein